MTHDRTHQQADQSHHQLPLQRVPNSGVVLYVGVDERQAAASGTTVIEIAELLGDFARELVPGAETLAAVALPSRHGTPSDLHGELRAVGAALRVAPPAAPEPQSESQHAADPVAVDELSRRLLVEGREIGVTPREFELIAYLSRHAGRAVTRHELMQRVWDQTLPIGDRTVDVHVRRLRSKLGRYSGRIRTVRGFGYRYDVPAAA